MRSLKKPMLAAATAGTLALAGVGVAGAVTDFVDGGQWDHGNDGGRVFSNYHHPAVNHGSSVQGHEFVDSGCQPANEWARAQAKSKFVGTDGSYYRFC